MNQTEAQRIAASINILRPDWPIKLLMSVLGDDKMIRRPYVDALVALTVCAVDPTTQKPGRVHENGIWWSAAAAANPAAPKYRPVIPGHCVICGQGWALHHADHEYANPFDIRKGVGPTPEQKAAIEAARIEAQKARPEPAPKREPRDPQEIIQSHIEEKTA